MDKNNQNLLDKLKEWLNKPYYFEHSTNFKLKVSFSFGLIVFLLLVFFKPANVSVSSKAHLFYKFTFGCITTCNLLFFFFVVTKLFHNFFDDENWTVGKHFITIISLILFSSIIRWLYLVYIIPDDFGSDVDLLKMIRVSFSLGIFFVLLFIYIDEKYQFKKYSKIQDEIKDKKTPTLKKNKGNKEITIYSSNKKDTLKFLLKDLVYISSEKNYACFFLKKNENNIKEEILRVPLQNVEEALENYKKVFRCHKSYIINAYHVNDVSGNARGYYLHTKNDKKIPVSRKFSKNELENLIFNSN